jgi:putative NADH-flavin reductase
MNVTIFGATGFSGKEILQEALAQNYKVTILVRSFSVVNIQHPNLNIIQGNVLNRDDVAKCLTNQNAVIQCLGIGGKGDGKPTTFISNATKIIVEEMEKQKVPRLIAMSNIGAGNSVAFQPKIFTKFILPYFMKWLQVIIDDKNRMEPIIMQSSLQWTIIRFPNITNKPAKKTISTSLDGECLKMSITNKDAAGFIMKQLSDNTFLKQAPSVSN